MKILLNFNLKDNDYIIFEENENFYLGHYQNNKFELIKNAAKNDLKNLVNQLITKPITKEEFLNNGIIIKNKDINIEKDLDKAIKLDFENHNSKNLKQNCLLLNENSQKTNNTNKQCLDSNQNDEKFKTTLIRYKIFVITINFLISFVFLTAINNRDYSGTFGGFEQLGDILIINFIQNFFSIIIEYIIAICIAVKYLPNINKLKFYIYIFGFSLLLLLPTPIIMALSSIPIPIIAAIFACYPCLCVLYITSKKLINLYNDNMQK